MKRLVVLISGTGSNLQAIIDAIYAGDLAAQIVGVISNVRGVKGLERARLAGIPAWEVPALPREPRRQYDSRLAPLVATLQPDIVVLAGWLRILSTTFLQQFPKVVNIHPALPGTFPGLHAIDRAWEAYRAGEITQTGVMVHWVTDEQVDAGPVLAQKSIPITPDMTLEDLEARVHQVEHRLLVQTLKRL